MKTIVNIAWLGGLCEGEASFSMKRGAPKISLDMTDKDTVFKAAELFGVKVSSYVHQPKGKSTYKPVYRCQVHSKRAIGWMMTLYSFFGLRRQAKVREILAMWKARRHDLRTSRGGITPSRCHPESPSRGFGLCMKCYMREWRKHGARAPKVRMATCHPDRKYRALGLCEACYLKQWRAQWKVA